MAFLFSDGNKPRFLNLPLVCSLPYFRGSRPGLNLSLKGKFNLPWG